jgi:multicomponent Na+:H+ antiporter subunit F
MAGNDMLFTFASRISLVLLLISIILTFIRLVKGSHAADRIVAIDLISILIVAFLAAYSIHTQETSFLDVAIAYALIAFLGTVAFSRFLIRSTKTDDKPETTHRKENE